MRCRIDPGSSPLLFASEMLSCDFDNNQMKNNQEKVDGKRLTENTDGHCRLHAQLQADYARNLAAVQERHKEELAASVTKAARERELLVALHQQELAAKERQAEQEVCCSLLVLPFLVAEFAPFCRSPVLPSRSLSSSL